MRNTIQSVKGVILGLIVVLGISVASAGTYVGPTSAPTGGNPDAPINVGSSIQAKQGSLSVFAFTANQNAFFAQKVGVSMDPSSIPGTTSSGSDMNLSVDGAVGADAYCNKAGTTCVNAGDLGGGGGDGTGTPAGAVMAFNLAACPSGWSEFTSAQGRYIVGLPSGGTLGLTKGKALANGENRATGAHRHVESEVYFHMGGYQPGIGNGADGRNGNTGISTPTITTTYGTGATGNVEGTNAPYIQLRYCVKS